MMASAGLAAPQGPPPPKEYQAQLRYYIGAARDQHIVAYDALVKYLKSTGFQFVPGAGTDREDVSKNTLAGTIASANALKLLGNAHVQAVLLLPPKYKLPARAEEPVKVQLTLASGFRPERQRALFNQTLDILAKLGFQEGIGYDHRGFTRVVGTIPSGQVETLLKDLRDQPAGWLSPRVPRKELPTPLRNVSPVQISEVIPEPAGVTPITPLPAAKAAEGNLEKISPDLRDLLTKGKKTDIVRLEIILALTPDDRDRGWWRLLERAAPGLSMEGRLGPLVTGTIPVGAVAELAALPGVSTVRLPRPARPQLVPVKGSAADNSQALRELGVHRLGIPRKGVRIAVIDSDFRGYESFIKNKQLPPVTRYLDLTAERNPNLLPDPFPGDPKEVGHGTRCALALAQAMAGSGVDLVLIRIDPATPYQLQEVARYINGEVYRSESLVRRVDEMDRERSLLRRRRADLLVERKAILDNFGQDEETLALRKAYFKKERALQADERDFRQLELRYLQWRKDLAGLRGVQVVSSSLVWHDGYPVDGSSPLSRHFSDRPFKAALWFQSAGNTQGQSWAGLFRDTDGNGVMEFAAPETPLAKGRWTRELNFLAWQPFGKAPALDLPAGTRLRISMQWREPHDPEYLRRGEDLYRTPLARLRLVLLRQRDPQGKDLATDDMEEVANTPGYEERFGLPQRLANSPSSATYEQVLEFTVPRAGRYALSVEGKVPAGIRPAGVASLPAFEKRWELRPRLFIEAVDEASRSKGRPVFEDYATGEGSLGVPADARHVITVGAANGSNKPQPYSARGPAMNLDLLPKPDLLAYEDGRLGGEGAVAYGTSLATPTAAGLAARALFGGTTAAEYLNALKARPGRVLRAPKP
jgi:subtilisin family serine protease